MNRKNTGLTLIESLVVITIMSVLAASVYIVFKSGMDAWSKSEAHLEIFQNARVVLDQMSRELPGAFVGGGATFEGTDGSGGNPVSLRFVTDFGDNIYKLYYWLDTSGSPAVNILFREYIENPADYTSETYVDSIEFGLKVSDIQFSYLPLGSSDWSSALTTWSGATLPEAVKVELKLKEKASDDDAEAHQFETIIYLPNS